MTEWEETRYIVLIRDRHRCYRCKKRSGSYIEYTSLTIHHLIPRSEGGGDHESNLITLCERCHDFVEINNLRSLTEILGSIEVDPISGDLVDVGGGDDWHTWVYGGCKNPEVDVWRNRWLHQEVAHG